MNDRLDEVPGARADRPTEIPKRGWWQIVKRAWKESKADNVPIIAAGLAFFSFLAIFPALIAAVLLYGLVADPQQITEQVNSFASAMPESAQKLLTDQLTSLASSSSGALSIGLVIAVLGALWSASGGVSNLIKGINIAYDEEESRGFVKLRGLSLLLTVGGIFFMLIAITLIAVMPPVLGSLPLGAVGRVLAEVARWLLLIVFVMVALALLYRIAPDRDAPKMRWASIGAVVATVLWIVASFGFSLYVDNFGKYAKTYGALAGVVVLLLWLFISAYIVLLGAEINAESELQTAQDTTKGPEQPMGTRRAVKADSIAEPEHQD